MSALNKFARMYNFQYPGCFKKFVYHFDEQFTDTVLTDKTILEVGCGRGFIAMWIALFKGVRKVVALDESEGVGSEIKILIFLKKYLKELNIKNIEVVKSNIMANQFRDNTFDIIISNNALHHVVRTGKYISKDKETKKKWIELFVELRRLLKSRGQLFVQEFSRNNIWRFSPIKLRFKQIDWEIHPTLSEWLEVISLAGFRDIKYQRTVNYKLRGLYFLSRNSIASFFLNSSFDIYATK